MQKNTSLLEKLKHRTRTLKGQSYALYLAYRHPDTPWYARAFAGLVAAYAFSPIDLIPDFIPLVGYLDDLVLIPLGVTLALKLIPPDVLSECQAQAAAHLEEDKPVSLAAGAVIVLIWLVVTAVLVDQLVHLWA